MSFFENIYKEFTRYRTTTIRFRKEYYLIDKFNIFKNNRNYPILIDCKKNQKKSKNIKIRKSKKMK